MDTGIKKIKKAVIVPDSFKGTMTSLEVCKIINKAFKKIKPAVKTVQIPIADGGEGTADAFLYAAGGEKIFVKSKNPLFEDISCYYAILKDKKTAVIETSAASGLTLIENKKDPINSSTFGTGLLIMDALEKNCEKIILSLGGSATTDGGAGIIAALGAKLLDKNNKEIIPSNRGLENLKYIDETKMDKRLKNIKFTAACDVDNILCGKSGAAYVFGPQKGADEKTVKSMDKNLKKYSGLLFEKTKIDVKNIPKTGAAGGILASLICFPEYFNCKIKSGIDIILEIVNFDEIIKDADLIITGEGNFDSQSLRGKAVFGIAKRAKMQNKPVIVIAGGTKEYGDKIYDLGIEAVFSSCSGLYKDLNELKRSCKNDLLKTTENILRLI